MERDFALRIDSQLSGVRASLASIADYMKHHAGKGPISKREFKELVEPIGKSMGATIELSNKLYQLFPDIIPDELKDDKS